MLRKCFIMSFFKMHDECDFSHKKVFPKSYKKNVFFFRLNLHQYFDPSYIY